MPRETRERFLSAWTSMGGIRELRDADIERWLLYSTPRDSWHNPQPTPSPVYTFSTPYYMWKGKKIYISLARGNSNYILRGAPPILIDRKTEGQEEVTVLSLVQRPIDRRSHYNSRWITNNLYVPVFRYGDNVDNEKYRVYRNRLNTFIRNSFKAFDRRYKSLVPVLKDINPFYLRRSRNEICNRI